MLRFSTSRTLIASTLFLGATALFSSAAFAGTTTGSVNVSGTVTSTLDMSVSSTSGATSLALDSSAAGVKQTPQVANLNISTNSEQGYDVSVSSGNLVDDDGVGTPIPYRVAVVADGATAADSDFNTAPGTAYHYQTSIANAPADGARDLYIQYTPAALQDPGSYTATINLTVTDR